MASPPGERTSLIKTGPRERVHPGSGRVDGVLATMPLMAMLLVFGLWDGLTRGDDWRFCFA